MRRKNPKKTTQYTKAKKRIIGILGNKGKGPTKAQRRAMHAALEKHLGHKILKLSDVVGKPSRFRVKSRQTVYKVEKRWQQGESKLVGYKPDRSGWREEPIYEWTPAREVVVSKIPVGEKLVVKRVSKKGARKKGSKRGEGPVISGRAAAIKYKKAKRKRKRRKGGRVSREEKKKRKKRKKKR